MRIWPKNTRASSVSWYKETPPLCPAAASTFASLACWEASKPACLDARTACPTGCSTSPTSSKWERSKAHRFCVRIEREGARGLGNYGRCKGMQMKNALLTDTEAERNVRTEPINKLPLHVHTIIGHKRSWHIILHWNSVARCHLDTHTFGSEFQIDSSFFGLRDMQPHISNFILESMII